MERMDMLLKVACEAARLSGSALEGRRGMALEIKKKTSAVDLVTEMDLKSEKVIVEYILSHFPSHSILAEENLQGKEGAASQYRWIIDPLDGTTNYAHGYLMYCVSIAVEVEGVVRVGAVYHPPMNEMFTAISGQGAWANGKPLHVSSTEKLGEALTVTGFPYDVREPPHTNLDYFCRFLTRTQAVRRDGAAALDLAYVAAGRFDGFWELKLKPWDVAAGCLMVREAGGRVTSFRDEEASIYSGELLATNGKIHDQMVQLLAETGDG